MIHRCKSYALRDFHIKPHASLDGVSIRRRILRTLLLRNKDTSLTWHRRKEKYDRFRGISNYGSTATLHDVSILFVYVYRALHTLPF